MIDFQLLEVIALSAPIVCALTCMVMMMLDAEAQRKNSQERRLRLFLALTYVVTSLGWLGMVFYVDNSRFFASYYTVFLLTLMLDQVMIYRFVSLITSMGERRKFNRLHLIIPVTITLISLFCDINVPVERQVAVIYGHNEADADSGFKIMYIFTVVVFIVYNTLYPILNLRYIHHYRRFIADYYADAYRTSLGWLFVIQVLILISVPFPLAALLMGLSGSMSGYVVWFGALPYFINYLILCYNLLDNNYLIIQYDVPEVSDMPDGPGFPIDPEHFWRYLREKKPYLNPSLRITDLAADLNTNRSYVSAFIKQEYGMNFCRFINRCRLEELDRLSLASSKKSNMDLLLMAGFSSYRSYLRVKKEEDKIGVLKVFESN